MLGKRMFSYCVHKCTKPRILKGARNAFFHCTTVRTSKSSPEFPEIDFYSDRTDQDSGDYKYIASQSEFKRPYVEIDMMNRSYLETQGKGVWLRGRVSKIRSKGNACFVVIRSKSLYSIQACCFKEKSAPVQSKELLQFISTIPLESIVDIYGELVPAEVLSCTQNDVEIAIKRVFVVSRAPVVLPFLIDDASRSDQEIEASLASGDKPYARVEQDLRLNNRWLDLRVPANNAIMRVKGGVQRLFREALYTKGFTEICSPKLIAGQSEGGAEVFHTDYFGQRACLAQSPQLYKQMALSADMDRVFEVGPVFRAENSKTRRHLCEFVGLDLEMTISGHYNELLEVVHDMFRHIFDGLEKHYPTELRTIRQQYPSDPVQFTDKPVIVHWPEAMQMLKDKGEEPDELGDLSTNLELLLGACVKEKFGTDFFILDQYPLKIRPFYTMPSPHNPLYSNSYDMFIRGQEICSGAQRCHDVELLTRRVGEHGIDPESIRFYLDSFRHGISPHAGAGIGLERVVFLYLGSRSTPTRRLNNSQEGCRVILPLTVRTSLTGGFGVVASTEFTTLDVIRRI